MEVSDLKVGLNDELQAIVDTVAARGYEVLGIKPAGFVNSERERPAYEVIVARAQPKEVDPAC